MNIPIPWMNCFLNVIPESDEPIGNIWTDEDEILVKTESAANVIADLIEMLYRADDESVEICTGYYDPEEDKRNDEVDEHTGWWYIRLNG